MIDYSQFRSIVVAGSIAYDDIMNFPGRFKDHFHPEKLHQINISFVVEKLSKHLGGTAANIAYNARLISNKKISITGAMGKDCSTFIKMFKSKNIDYSDSIIDKELYTSTGKVITDNVDNQIWGYYYGAGIRGKDIDYKNKFKTKDNFFIISANHPDAFLHVQKHCIQNRLTYLYDPGMSLTFISDKDLENGIQQAAFVVGNDYEISQIERRLEKPLLSMMRKNSGLITTLGEQGVIFQSPEKQIKISGYKIKKVVDPTGAGDAWRGGFVGSLIDGKTISQSIKTANALASFAVENLGTINHTPSITQIQERAEKIEILN